MRCCRLSLRSWQLLALFVTGRSCLSTRRVKLRSGAIALAENRGYPLATSTHPAQKRCFCASLRSCLYQARSPCLWPCHNQSRHLGSRCIQRQILGQIYMDGARNGCTVQQIPWNRESPHAHRNIRRLFVHDRSRAWGAHQCRYAGIKLCCHFGWAAEVHIHLWAQP